MYLHTSIIAQKTCFHVSFRNMCVANNIVRTLHRSSTCQFYAPRADTDRFKLCATSTANQESVTSRQAGLGGRDPRNPRACLSARSVSHSFLALPCPALRACAPTSPRFSQVRGGGLVSRRRGGDSSPGGCGFVSPRAMVQVARALRVCVVCSDLTAQTFRYVDVLLEQTVKLFFCACVMDGRAGGAVRVRRVSATSCS